MQASSTGSQQSDSQVEIIEDPINGIKTFMCPNKETFDKYLQQESSYDQIQAQSEAHKNSNTYRVQIVFPKHPSKPIYTAVIIYKKSSAYVNFIYKDGSTQPSGKNTGWKIHISVGNNLDLKKTWDIIRDISIQSGIPKSKVIKDIELLEDEHIGKHIAIYCFEAPDKEWLNIINEIELNLRAGSVIGAKKPSGNADISGSWYMSYRDDSCTLEDIKSLEEELRNEILTSEENKELLRGKGVDITSTNIINEIKGELSLYIDGQCAIKVAEANNTKGHNPFNHAIPKYFRVLCEFYAKLCVILLFHGMINCLTI